MNIVAFLCDFMVHKINVRYSFSLKLQCWLHYNGEGLYQGYNSSLKDLIMLLTECCGVLSIVNFSQINAFFFIALCFSISNV